MNIPRLLSSFMLAALTMTSFQASAKNIDATAAKAVAHNFIKQQTASKFKASTAASLKLTHAEPSSKVNGAFDYYAFNVDGGGFVIVAGEDRAAQVLGYSDQGRIDFNNLPAPLQDLLNGYKAEIEYLQTYEGDDLVPAPATFKDSGTVGPLIQTTWGQEMPYYLQCPLKNGEYCVVGCVATAMAMVMNYWQYPTELHAQNRYYSSGYGNVPALPATTVDYSLMLNSYCHWDWDNSELIQDTYTDAQAQEVAKLGRYCGQAVQMQYSPDGSGAYTYNQESAMQDFGYTSARLYEKSGWGGWSNNYSTAQWEAMIKTEIDAGRPILYSANDPSAGGHAFICDGYNSEGKFHFNYGWYGTCDGWYVSTALNMTHRDGDYLQFNSGHEMITGIQPPVYCTINAELLDANNDLIILGDGQLNAKAQNVTFNTSYSSLNLLFSLTDAGSNRLANSAPVNVAKSTFVQGSTVDGTLALPSTLESGTYDLKLYYYTTDANQLTAIPADATGQLLVVGKVAKYNSPFSISDVITMVNIILNDSNSPLSISDATEMINYILTH